MSEAPPGREPTPGGPLQRVRTATRDPVLRNTAYLVGNSLSLAFAGFVFWVVVARRFPPEAVGLATALISTTLMITLVSTTGLDFSALRDIPRAGDPVTRDRIVNACLGLSGLVGLVGAGAFLLLAGALTPALTGVLAEPWVQVTFVAWVGFQTASAVSDKVFTAAGRADVVFWKNNAASALKLALALALPTALGAYMVFTANTLPMTLVLVAAVLVLLRHAFPGYALGARPRASLLKGLLGFGLVAHVAHLLFMAPQHLAPVVVLNSLGAREAAFLYTAWKIAALLWMITIGAMGPLLAFGAANPQRYYRVLLRVLVAAVVASTAAAVVLVAFGGHVLLLFGSAYAANAQGLLGYLAVASVPVSLFALYMTTLRVYGNHVELVGASLAFAAVTFTAFAIAPSLGGLAAFGAAWLAATSVFGALALARLFGPFRVDGLVLTDDAASSPAQSNGRTEVVE